VGYVERWRCRDSENSIGRTDLLQGYEQLSDIIVHRSSRVKCLARCSSYLRRSVIGTVARRWESAKWRCERSGDRNLVCTMSNFETTSL
jgi:hypothetical protein